MRTTGRLLTIVGLLLGLVQAASAQTADEIIEKHLAAIGGRAALEKLKSRSTVGTVTLSTPLGDISGPVEIMNEAPNKTRTAMTLEVPTIGQIVIDQRFDGQNGYVIDSLQGNRDITGDQLEAMKNGSFPTPFLNHKTMGGTVELAGKEKAGERDAFVLIVKRQSGPPLRAYIDAESYLPIKTVVKINVPQLGREIEQTSEFSDYREVDGVKIPFEVRNVSSVQTLVVKITKVEHNVHLDESLFSKPAK
jgi:zinc protease